MVIVTRDTIQKGNTNRAITAMHAAVCLTTYLHLSQQGEPRLNKPYGASGWGMHANEMRGCTKYGDQIYKCVIL